MTPAAAQAVPAENFAPWVRALGLTVEARVLRLGRTLAFGEVALRAAGTGALAAHATTTYALPSER